VNLGAERWTRLKALITRNDVFIKSLEATMTNTFASLLFMYLYRISGLRRLSIGVVFHNRLTQVQKETVGLFMEVLPFVVTIRPEESFLGLIQRVHQEAREALQHRQYSVGNPVHTPAHTVLLHFTRSMQLNETLVGVQRIHSGHGESSLSLSVIDPGCMEDLELWFDCRTDLFDPAIIDRMVGHFLTLLDAVVGNPDQPISQLPLLTETERHQLLVDWNNTRKDYPGNLRIHQLFESQVARTPEAVAVVLEENQLTYRELNHRANQLACHLRVLGVRPDVLVGVYMERSLELLVALVGILKAGGAYVPLDPDYPEERLRFMLEDTRAPVLLTQERLARQLPKQASRLFLLDSGWETVAKECEEDPVNVAEPDSLAYVIYTSGSTGRPKGVMICHRSVCNHLLWRHEYFPLTDKDRLLQKASPNFDDSVWEFFEPLMVGARLIMTPPGKQQDSAYLVQLIADQQITAACFVPSMLQVLLEEPGLERCGCLRRMTTGGELLSVALQNRFSSYLDADLYNGYGPTEATISASFWHCQHGEHGRVVPIGRPIANTQIYLLDSNLQPVPVGVPGEIYIGGAGVARGYLNLPELTAENFIAHPYTHEPGARLYRTGDLARYRPDGNLEFLGRMDSQVKIRGFRVELGEIETVLSQHPAVEQSLVILEEDLSGNKRLVAYLVGLHSPAPSASELRSFLSRRLPNYMIPAAFVSLETFPRLPNGKVDRRALLALGAARPERERGFAEPRTPLEREVAGIWEEMLGLARVGIYEDFFELGGDSLLATQLISRMRSIFHIELPLRRLFEAPTVADLSEALLLRLAEKAESAEMDR
jgi:amino acid adenylation domain-containing protein